MLNHFLICSYTEIFFSQSLLIVNFLGFYMLKNFFTLNLKTVFFFFCNNASKEEMRKLFSACSFSIFNLSWVKFIPQRVDSSHPPGWHYLAASQEVRFHHKIVAFCSRQKQGKNRLYCVLFIYSWNVNSTRRKGFCLLFVCLFLPSSKTSPYQWEQNLQYYEQLNNNKIEDESEWMNDLWIPFVISESFT